MKLFKIPNGLSIDAIEHINRILALLVETIKNQGIFSAANSLEDYQETINDLHRDMADYFELYEEW